MACRKGAPKQVSLGQKGLWVGRFLRLVRNPVQRHGRECRVLVVFNAAKEKYQAVLGVMAADILSVLCTYEYHAVEPGWHCHAVCEDVRTAPRGCMRGPWVDRIPGAHAFHNRMSFGIESKLAAKRFAFDIYKIVEPGPLL